ETRRGTNALIDARHRVEATAAAGRLPLARRDRAGMRTRVELQPVVQELRAVGRFDHDVEVIEVGDPNHGIPVARHPALKGQLIVPLSVAADPPERLGVSVAQQGEIQERGVMFGRDQEPILTVALARSTKVDARRRAARRVPGAVARFVAGAADLAASTASVAAPTASAAAVTVSLAVTSALDRLRLAASERPRVVAPGLRHGITGVAHLTGV